jgi:hypothetical protein
LPVKRPWKQFLLFGTVFMVGAVTGVYVDSWLDIDTCLDSGGAWDYVQEYCRRQ